MGKCDAVQIMDVDISAVVIDTFVTADPLDVTVKSQRKRYDGGHKSSLIPFCALDGRFLCRFC